jgi:tellurite resistance protein TerC
MKWARLKRIKAALSLKDLPGPLRKLIVGVIGGTVVLIGVAMIVLPGPAFIVIPVGLGILATEFAWARRAVRRARAMIAKARRGKSLKTRVKETVSR